MTAPELIIGIDLDNTLVCYDELFHIAACEQRLIEPSLPKRKEEIRDAIRLLPDGERRWTRLQAVVYGPRMSGATMFDGADVFFRHCARRHTPVKIVSHKTTFTMLDDRPIDLRLAAREWLQAKAFFPDFAIASGDIFFESTRAEKIERIRSLRCTHFIDDLAEVFAESAFPRETQPLLFAPHGRPSLCSEVRAFKSWCELDRFFFDEARS
jgi:hypothetical protein